MPAVLELKNISKTFNPGTVNEKLALQKIDLNLKDGDFATIVGSNGAGKSTMFNAIAGEFISDTGTITLDGQDITFMPDYRRSKYIGRMFQDPLRGTAPHLTIEENLALAYLRASGHTSSFSRISKKDRDLFAEKLSALGLGLEDRMKQPVGLLSGGQRQALTLLMATLVTPKLLLLDEHTAALDPATAEKVLDLTKKIVAENHITCLMITHNMHDALTLGNRTLMMDHGRIVLDVADEERRERRPRTGQRPHLAERGTINCRPLKPPLGEGPREAGGGESLRQSFSLRPFGPPPSQREAFQHI